MVLVPAEGTFAAEGTLPGKPPTKVGWIRFFVFRFATSWLICSPPFADAPNPVCVCSDLTSARPGDGGGVMRALPGACRASAGTS